MGVEGIFHLYIKLPSKVLAYLKSADRQVASVQRGIRKGFFLLGKSALEELRAQMKKPKHGRFYTYKKRLHRASAPGESPAYRSGKLSKTSTYTVSGALQCSFGYTQDYGIWLERGTRKMRVRPNLIPTATKVSKKFVGVFGKEILTSIKNKLG